MINVSCMLSKLEILHSREVPACTCIVKKTVIAAYDSNNVASTAQFLVNA